MNCGKNFLSFSFNLDSLSWHNFNLEMAKTVCFSAGVPHPNMSKNIRSPTSIDNQIEEIVNLEGNSSELPNVMEFRTRACTWLVVWKEWHVWGPSCVREMHGKPSSTRWGRPKLTWTCSKTNMLIARRCNSSLHMCFLYQGIHEPIFFHNPSIRNNSVLNILHYHFFSTYTEIYV